MNLTVALDRIFEPLLSALTPDVAEKLLQFRTDDKLQMRLDELADKANEGQLTPEETREYDTYLRGLTVVSVFQARARALLRHKAAG